MGERKHNGNVELSDRPNGSTLPLLSLYSITDVQRMCNGCATDPMVNQSWLIGELTPASMHVLPLTYTTGSRHNVQCRYSKPVLILDLVKQQEKTRRESIIGSAFRDGVRYVCGNE